MTEPRHDLTNEATPGLLDPTTRAVAGLALAVVGLMGQNVVQVGVQVLLVGAGGSGNPRTYFVASAIGALLLPVAALALTWAPARGAMTGWSTYVARAAVVVAAVAVAGAVLMALGGLLTDGLGGGLVPM